MQKTTGPPISSLGKTLSVSVAKPDSPGNKPHRCHAVGNSVNIIIDGGCLGGLPLAHVVRLMFGGRSLLSRARSLSFQRGRSPPRLFGQRRCRGAASLVSTASGTGTAIHEHRPTPVDALPRHGKEEILRIHVLVNHVHPALLVGQAFSFAALDEARVLFIPLD